MVRGGGTPGGRLVLRRDPNGVTGGDVKKKAHRGAGQGRGKQDAREFSQQHLSEFLRRSCDKDFTGRRGIPD